MATLQDLIDMNIGILREDIAKINLSGVADKIDNDQYRQYFLEERGVEHYKLLAWIATLFGDSKIFDIGTHYGNSSIAMSYAKNAKVVSYDIVEMKQLNSLPENVEYKIGDFRANPEVLSSPFIFIDVDPHDGIQEKDFHQFFLKKNYKGITMWDDINVNKEMRFWWDSITEPNAKKNDISLLGHWSGTGMIIYG